MDIIDYLVNDGCQSGQHCPMVNDNRSNILQAALHLFATKGYEAVGVLEIARAAGISKPTLYYYFGSKLGLLEAVLHEHSHPLTGLIREAAVYRGDLAAALRNLTLVYFDYAIGQPLFYRMQLALYFAPPESESNRQVRPFLERQHRLLEQLFVMAAKDHPGLTGRQLPLSATFLGTVNTYIGLALNGYLDLNLQLADITVRQFVEGIFG